MQRYVFPFRCLVVMRSRVGAGIGASCGACGEAGDGRRYVRESEVLECRHGLLLRGGFVGRGCL